MTSDYDYLSILIQGGDICGATCFDPYGSPPHLLMATNKTGGKGHDDTLIKKTQEYLTLAAQAAQKINNASTDDEISAIKTNLKKIKESLIELGTKQFNAKIDADVQSNKPNKPTPQQAQATKDDYERSYKIAINQVTNSIFEGAMGSQEGGIERFSSSAIEAMAKDKFAVIGQETKGGDLHAELKILQTLVQRDNKQQGVPKHFYQVGTSKLLCSPCDVVFEAVNEQHKAKHEFKHSGSHGGYFPCAYPEIIACEPNLGRAVLEKLEQRLTGYDQQQGINDHAQLIADISLSHTALQPALKRAFHPENDNRKDEIIQARWGQQHTLVPVDRNALDTSISKLRTRPPQAVTSQISTTQAESTLPSRNMSRPAPVLPTTAAIGTVSVPPGSAKPSYASVAKGSISAVPSAASVSLATSLATQPAAPASSQPITPTQATSAVVPAIAQPQPPKSYAAVAATPRQPSVAGPAQPSRLQASGSLVVLPTQGQALQDMDAILKSAAQADAKAKGHDMGGPAKK
jgi:hypothetical protein